MFQLTCISRQRKCNQEEHFKMKVRHNRMRILLTMTFWLEERLAGHGQQITGASDHRCWRLVYRAPSDTQEPCCADTCTLGDIAWTKLCRRRRASVKSGAGTGSDLGRTCHGSIRLVQLHWGRIAACLLSSSVHQPVDRYSSRRGCQGGDKRVHQCDDGVVVERTSDAA